jgi:hypothetical protein
VGADFRLEVFKNGNGRKLNSIFKSFNTEPVRNTTVHISKDSARSITLAGAWRETSQRLQYTSKKDTQKYYHNMSLFLFLHHMMKAGGWYGLGEIHGQGWGEWGEQNN